jgi:hypothetical protein
MIERPQMGKFHGKPVKTGIAALQVFIGRWNSLPQEIGGRSPNPFAFVLGMKENCEGSLCRASSQFLQTHQIYEPALSDAWVNAAD